MIKKASGGMREKTQDKRMQKQEKAIRCDRINTKLLRVKYILRGVKNFAKQILRHKLKFFPKRVNQQRNQLPDINPI